MCEGYDMLSDIEHEGVLNTLTIPVTSHHYYDLSHVHVHVCPDTTCVLL